ncbi:hypothetical protein ACPXCE_27895 [Streptomyces sp. DT24]|uniref:hypothetical protein n=1 Tax=Streptomyces sp. DT24 TaxID=3416520 RepID=UPI003CF91080
MTQTSNVSQALVGTHGPAIAVQSLTTGLGLVPPLDFHQLEDQTSAELKTLTPDVREKAVRALRAIDGHMELVEAFADGWSGTLLPSLFHTAEDVHGHAVQIDQVGGSVRKKIRDLGYSPTRKQQEDVLDSAQSSLKALLDTLESRTARAEELAEQLLEGAKSVKEAGDAFAGDRAAVDQAITGDKGIIDQINQRVAALSQEITVNASKIAQGQFGKVPGIGLIVVGAVLAVVGQPSAGLGVFTTGIGLLTKEGFTLGDVDLVQEKGELAGKLAALSVLRASILRFGISQDGVTQLQANLARASAKGPGLHQVWTDHGTGLTTTIDTIGKALADPHADLSPVVTGTDRFLDGLMRVWAEGKQTATTITSGLTSLQGHVDKTLLDHPHSAT